MIPLLMSFASFAYPAPEANRCQLNVQIEASAHGLSSLGEAEEFCSRYGDLCKIRKFEFDTWDADLRVRKVIRGRNARDVLQSFDRFLRRSVFVEDGYDINITFVNCRQSSPGDGGGY